MQNDLSESDLLSSSSLSARSTTISMRAVRKTTPSRSSCSMRAFRRTIKGNARKKPVLHSPVLALSRYIKASDLQCLVCGSSKFSHLCVQGCRIIGFACKVSPKASRHRSSATRCLRYPFGPIVMPVHMNQIIALPSPCTSSPSRSPRYGPYAPIFTSANHPGQPQNWLGETRDQRRPLTASPSQQQHPGNRTAGAGATGLQRAREANHRT